jgi:hypothetical protein
MGKRHTQADGAAVYDISRARLVQALKALHAAYGVYDKCDHRHAENDPAALFINEIGWTCDDGLIALICRHCCAQDGRGQHEDCATEHDHLPGHALCPTMAIVDGCESPWSS